MSARPLVAAIAADDAQALFNLWDNVPQTVASPLVLMAWRRDAAESRKAAVMADGGLVSAIYTKISRASRRVRGGGSTDDASMLLFLTAAEHDLAEMLALVYLWDECFTLAREPTEGEAAGADGLVKVGGAETVQFFKSTKAERCAEWAEYWFHGRTADASSSMGEAVISICTPPEPLKHLVGERRIVCSFAHPTFNRAQTAAVDLTKLVFFVQFDVIKRPPVGTNGKIALRNARSAACGALQKRGYVLLEACNMRAVFYDGGQSSADFKSDADAAARAVRPKMVAKYAGRRADPGPALITADQEPLLLGC